MSESIQKARSIACSSHLMQTRKYTGQPYIIHCAAVASMIDFAQLPGDAVAAAWLHDVVEDSDVTNQDLVKEFGSDVARIVEFCTQISTKNDGDRKAQKLMDIEHYANGCSLAQSIKVADMLDNVPSIVAFDPVFAKTYLEEKRQLLDKLTLAKSSLLQSAHKMMQHFERQS